MNEREYKIFSEYIRKCTERVKTDKKYARQVLLSTGVYTNKGKLKKRFR